MPIARALGEALAVLGATVSSTSNMSSRVIVTVSAEVASAVVEAEELVDDLLGVIQVSSHRGSRFTPLISTTYTDEGFVGLDAFLIHSKVRLITR